MTDLIIIILIWAGALALTYYPAKWTLDYFRKPPRKRYPPERYKD